MAVSSDCHPFNCILIVISSLGFISEMVGSSLSTRMENAVTSAKAMGFVEKGDAVVVVTMEDGDAIEGSRTLGRRATMMILSVA